MRDDDKPWVGHEKIAVWKLAGAGAGAVGFYDELVESCSKPGATVSTAIDAVDISPGTQNVRKVLVQSLHGFESASPKDREIHVRLFTGMLKRLDGEKAVAAHSDEINAGMHNLIRECQRQYNKGRTANPARTAELIQMVDEADKAGCLENPLYSGMKKWVVEQRKWEASEEGKAFKDQQDADRAAKYVGKKAPQRVSAAPVATTAPPRTPQTKAATQVKKPSGRSH